MKTIFALDKNNNQKEYQVILTYHSDDYNKDYVVYTDNIYNDNGELQIYINSYNPDDLELIANEIKDKEEYNTIKTLVNSVLLTMKNENDKLD